jgi:hypothetical protein
MKQRRSIDTDILKRRIEEILVLLQELDRVYHSGSLAEYERKYQTVEQKVRQTLPGLTIAYAEIYTAGSSRAADGRMTHVLLLLKERKPD